MFLLESYSTLFSLESDALRSQVTASLDPPHDNDTMEDALSHVRSAIVRIRDIVVKAEDVEYLTVPNVRRCLRMDRDLGRDRGFEEPVLYMTLEDDGNNETATLDGEADALDGEAATLDGEVATWEDVDKRPRITHGQQPLDHEDTNKRPRGTHGQRPSDHVDKRPRSKVRGCETFESGVNCNESLI